MKNINSYTKRKTYIGGNGEAEEKEEEEEEKEDMPHAMRKRWG